MGQLQKMKDRINKLTDPEILEVAAELLEEMADIQRLKEQIELREEGLTDGKRAAFYFFAQGLNPEELAHACSTAKGRLRVLKDKKERELADARRNGEITEEEEAEAKENINKTTPFSNSFGGLGDSFSNK